MLNNKVVVITGGAGFLGQAFVKAVVENGGTAIIGDINEKNGEDIKTKIESETDSDKIDFVKLDITSKDSALSLIREVTKKHGKIDALVNSAYPRNKNFGRCFEDVAYDDFCENINLHLGGFFLMAQQFCSFFEKQGYGNIVSMASIYGVVAPRFEIYEGTQMTVTPEYAVIKSAIVHFTKYLAKWCKGKNIRVNCISPGGILDKQPESFLEKYNSFGITKGMLDKEDVSGCLVFLLSDSSKFISGQNIIVDDGWCL